MKKAIIISILVIAAALMAACEREADRPIAPQGVGQQTLNIDNQVNFLRGVLRDDPQNASAWTKLGNITMDAQRFEEAIEAYGKAMELDPANVNIIVDRGICYRRIGRSDISLEHFRKGISIDPNHLNAHKNLAVVLGYDFRQYGEAADEFQKYLDLAPAAPDRAQIEGIIGEFRAAAGANQ